MTEVNIPDIERSVDVILGKIENAGKAELEDQESKLAAFLAWFHTQDKDRCRVMNKILKAKDTIFRKRKEVDHGR